MQAPSAVGEAQAREFLGAQLEGGVEDVALLGDGAWSRCFGFRHAGRDLVVRFGRFREDFEKDRLASGFDRPGLPVPRVHEIGRAFGAWFAVSDRVYGEPIEACSAEGWRALLPALFAALDALRGIDPCAGRAAADARPTRGRGASGGWGVWDASGAAAHASWRDFLLAVNRDTPDRRTHGWRRRLKASPGGVRGFRAGYLKLAALADAGPPGRHLVHADLINRNVLVAGGRITGVFDWGCSLYGDFLYELAWLVFWAPWHDAMARIDWVAEAKRHFHATGLDVPDLEARLRACQIHIGLDHLAYNAWAGRGRDLEALTERMRPLVT